MIDNKWRHGPVFFENLQLGPVLSDRDGLAFYVVIDPDVGPDIFNM